MSDPRRVLVVEDEPELLEMLRITLVRHGYAVETASRGLAVLTRLTQWYPQVILLDLSLPDLDGLQVIRRVRGAGYAARIVILSARGGDRDKVTALDNGADDYLTKPFSTEELLARIRVAFRHLDRPTSSDQASFGDVVLDVERRSATLRGEEIKLSKIEWRLLAALLAEPNRVLTHRALLREVWGPAYQDEVPYVHVYVSNLRKKLEPDPRRPRYLVSEPGVGYRFRPDG